MKYTLRITFLTLLFSVFFLGNVVGADDDCLPEKPKNGLIYDEVGLLDKNQFNNLNNKLIAFDNSTSTQIAVVIVNDICGMDRAMYTTELAHKWGVGQEGKDNGVVIMIKPTGGQGQRLTQITAGYGLDGAIPDAICKRIVENELIPYFKQNDFYGGLNAATDVLMGLAKGEFSADDYNKKTSNKGNFIYLIIIAIFVFFTFISRAGGARSYARSNNTSFWLALLLMNSSMSSHRGHYGNFSSGGGSFGGGSFGGFGGGGFGGGGAGGSW